jgi:hypothetical protein
MKVFNFRSHSFTPAVPIGYKPERERQREEEEETSSLSPQRDHYNDLAIQTILFT